MSNLSRSSTATFSSFTFSYLSRAIIWVRSLRKAHPDWDVFACMVDQAPQGVDFSTLLLEFDHVVLSKDLGIERYTSWIFKHDIVEACTAVKGKMLSRLLDVGYDKVVYFDPDIALFHPISDIIANLDVYSIVLTPHQSDPNPAQRGFEDNELTSMKYGIYNLGFVAVRNDTVGRAYAHWWADRLYEACYDEIEKGIFTDQKYCDLVPGLFSNVYVSRDPGCNLASWNLSTRRVEICGSGDIMVNGSPLKFYHFTKIGSEGDAMTDKYAGGNTEVIEIWNWYRRELSSSGVPHVPKGFWTYSNFANGRAISKKVREFYRRRTDLMAYFDDPFEVEGDCFFAWLKREEPTLLLPERM